MKFSLYTSKEDSMRNWKKEYNNTFWLRVMMYFSVTRKIIEHIAYTQYEYGRKFTNVFTLNLLAGYPESMVKNTLKDALLNEIYANEQDSIPSRKLN